MDYDTWKTTDPNADLTHCNDCGETTDHRLHAPARFSTRREAGYHVGIKGPVVCADCHELYNPAL